MIQAKPPEPIMHFQHKFKACALAIPAILKGIIIKFFKKCNRLYDIG